MELIVAMLGNPGVSMKLDRDKATGSFVLSSIITGANRTNLTFQPVPQGAIYPQPLGQ